MHAVSAIEEQKITTNMKIDLFRILIEFRWYYTSDTVVKEVTIDEVLNVSAYMLFYDRGTGGHRHQNM